MAKLIYNNTNWVDKLEGYLKKEALSSQSISDIDNWVLKNSSKVHRDVFVVESFIDELISIRHILGVIIGKINLISKIFSDASDGITEEVIESAKSIIDDLNNLDSLEALIKSAYDILSIIKERTIMNKQKGDYITENTEGLIVNDLQLCETIYQAISGIEPKHINYIQKLASGDIVPPKNKKRRSNYDAISQLLQKSIYSRKITLTVLREILQNAVDATLSHTDNMVGYKPSVDIFVSHYKDPNPDNYSSLTDITVQDNGIGMNFNILTEKFFVLGESGKRGSGQSAGGYGIAGEIIHNQPKEGFSVNTTPYKGGDPLHASSFYKNMYFAHDDETGKYSFPFPKVENRGTTLSVYSLPYEALFSIKELCSKYASNGSVKIRLNNEDVAPAIVLEKMVSLEGKEDHITDFLSKDEEDERIFSQIDQSSPEIKNTLKEIGLKLGKLNYNYENGKKTEISFLVKPVSYTDGIADIPKTFVFIKNQFQFDSYTVEGMDIAVMMNTNVPPNEEGYPVDIGRIGFREPYKSDVEGVLRELDDVMKKVISIKSEFEKYDTIAFNGEKEPLSTQKLGKEDDSLGRDSYDDDLSSRNFKNGLMREIGIGEGAGGQVFEKEKNIAPEKDIFGNPIENIQTDNPEKREEVSPYKDLGEDIDVPLDLKIEIPKTGAELAEKIKSTHIGDSLPVEKQRMLNTLLENLSIRKDEIDINEEMKKIFDGLDTPAHILTHRRFTTRDAINSDIGMEFAQRVLILWKECIEDVTKAIISFYSHRIYQDQKFIPGIIYSDEALAMYVPANKKAGRNNDTICINPLSIMSILHPEKFVDNILNYVEEDSDIRSERSVEEASLGGDNMDSGTPSERLAIFLYHTAIHEIVHLIWPDGYGNSNFHIWISKAEEVCHRKHVYEKIYKRIKGLTLLLKRDSAKMITALKRDLKKKRKMDMDISQIYVVPGKENIASKKSKWIKVN